MPEETSRPGAQAAAVFAPFGRCQSNLHLHAHLMPNTITVSGGVLAGLCPAQWQAALIRGSILRGHCNSSVILCAEQHKMANPS